MQSFSLMFDNKAKKLYLALDAEAQAQIDQALARDIELFEKRRKSCFNYLGNLGTGDYWWVRGERYRVLVRVENHLNRVRVIDIDRETVF